MFPYSRDDKGQKVICFIIPIKLVKIRRSISFQRNFSNQIHAIVRFIVTIEIDDLRRHPQW